MNSIKYKLLKKHDSSGRIYQASWTIDTDENPELDNLSKDLQFKIQFKDFANNLTTHLSSDTPKALNNSGNEVTFSIDTIAPEVSSISFSNDNVEIQGVDNSTNSGRKFNYESSTYVLKEGDNVTLTFIVDDPAPIPQFL